MTPLSPTICSICANRRVQTPKLEPVARASAEADAHAAYRSGQYVVSVVINLAGRDRLAVDRCRKCVVINVQR
jgi:hypothetical protein